MATDDHRQRFAEILATQPVGDGLTYEQVVKAQTRQELGISSLNMIIVLMNHGQRDAASLGLQGGQVLAWSGQRGHTAGRVQISS